MLTMRCSMGSRTHISREGWIEERMGDVTRDIESWIDRCGDRRGSRRVEGVDGCGFGRCVMDFSWFCGFL
jgi:hypothetical protein